MSDERVQLMRAILRIIGVMFMYCFSLHPA